jgi:hypothetical protein
LTEIEFTDWLKKGGRYTLLVEVDTTVPRYLSTVAYTTLPTDSPANRVYSPVVSGGVAFTETLPLDGSATLSVGDIELNNDDGLLDSWLDDIWVNKPIRIYIGDVSWVRADFRLIFTGIVANINSRAANRLNISLRDKLQRLNTPVSETLLGGTTSNKDRLIPLCFGEVHNVEPLLVDPATLKYKVHGSAIERLIEVRDNGVPVSINESLIDGTFTLVAQQAGTITCSVQGDKPTTYSNRIADTITRLVTGYGKVSDRLTTADIDTAQFAAFNTEHPQPVGVYLNDRSNVIEVCQQLASSVGAQISMSREGLLRLLKITLPATGTPLVVTPSDYVAKSLEIKERVDVKAAIKVGYCKNYTTQTGLNTGLPASHKDLFMQEYLSVTAKNQSVADTYKLNTEPVQTDTLLLTESDATAEANRLLTLWQQPRTVYKFVGYSHLLTVPLGQALTLVSPRFGLSEGKTGIVVGIQSDWVSRRVTIEVLI